MINRSDGVACPGRAASQTRGRRRTMAADEGKQGCADGSGSLSPAMPALRLQAG